MNPETERKGKFLHDIAEDNGVAVVVLDENNDEAATANNNSICGALWNSEEFRSRCDLDCGRAFTNTNNGKPFEYECHAGLSCRALPVEDNGQRFVAIIGRTFLSALKYRNATEKAISGEWNKFKPTEFFKNVLMSGSTAGIDNAAAGLSKFVVASPENVIEIFTAARYRVFMLGFLPGFAYMGEVDDRIATPRRETPRVTVPKGSVGIAGKQTGIYSLDSPGGWQIIGRTDVPMFISNAANPSLLQPGDTVRFVPVK